MDFSKWTIQDCLLNIKNAVINGEFSIINRKEYKDFMDSFDIFVGDIRDVILNLNVDDLDSGPEIDRGDASYDNKNIWIFKKKYNNGVKKINLYIKLKVMYNSINDKYHVKCISFHKNKNDK